jgi:polynucleotide 5'-hydroxyl-kinase GRC3/NOL9
MSDVPQSHSETIERLASAPGRIFVVGGVDTGKTTFALQVARAGVEAGHVAAVVDADLGQSSIGPPGTIGLKLVRSAADTEPGALGIPDAMSFVGSVSPRGHFLSLVSGTAKLVLRAIEMGARLIVVDTSGMIAGVAGQVLKLTKAELCRPHHVVALARGGELEPIVGILQRFLSVQITELGVHPDITVRSVDDRTAHRERRLAAFLGPEVYRWRVKSTVFFPSLPPLYDRGELDGLLVGVDDGTGNCLGLGILEYRDDALRLLTPVSEGVKALRLGWLRVTPDGTITDRVDLRAMLGTD